jgi:LysM repeat protein
MEWSFSYLNKQKEAVVRKLFWLWLVLIACIGLPAAHAQVEPVEVVPSGTIQEVEGRPYFFHHVKQGQTLYSISRAYSVSQDVIVAENPDVAFGLRYDQVIRIPAFLYNVAPQETEYGLSRSFGITMEQLRAFNPSIVEDGLKAGMQIAIPGYKTAETRKAVQPQPEPYIYLPRDPLPKEPVTEVLPCDMAAPASHYRVALLIPLFLEDAAPFMREIEDPDSRDRRIPPNHRSFSFLPYYQGVLLALDSIRQTGVDIRMEVIDVGQDMAGARTLVMREDFRDLDLIIGPFFPNTLEYIAGHARQYEISVVSPLLSDNSQLRNAPNVFQATPSLEAQLASLAKYIAGHYSGQNILLVHNNQPGAMPMINAFKSSLGREMHLARQFSDSLHLARVNGYFAEETLIGGRVTNVMVMSDSPDGRPFRILRRSSICAQAWTVWFQS